MVIKIRVRVLFADSDARTFSLKCIFFLTLSLFWGGIERRQNMCAKLVDDIAAPLIASAGGTGAHSYTHTHTYIHIHNTLN